MADVDERKRGAARLLLRDVYDCRQRLDRLGVLAYMMPAKTLGLKANRTFINNTIKSAEHHNRRVEEKACWQAKKQRVERKHGCKKVIYDAERQFWAEQKKKTKCVMSARTTVPLRQGELNGSAEADSDDGRKRKKKKKKKKKKRSKSKKKRSRRSSSSSKSDDDERTHEAKRFRF